jgi:hypothetical protein
MSKTTETKTDNTVGFEDLIGAFMPGENISKPQFEDDGIPYKDPEEIEGEEETNDTEEQTSEEVDESVQHQEEEEDTEESSEEKTDLGEYEADIAAFVSESLAKELDITFDENQKFESIKDVIDYMKQLVDENSKPYYPNEEVEKIAKFVEDGGDIRDFYKEIYSSLDVNNVDIESESDQKLIIKENLKDLGYSDDKIKRTLKRYEDAGVLEDEASDALETLKTRREEKTKKLLETQENNRIYIEKQQQNFIKDVTEEVKSMKDFYGMSLTEQEKRELLDYILKPSSDGQTKFQLDYAKDSKKNLIETALFLKKKNSLFKEASKNAKSEITKTLAQKLRNKSTMKVKGSGSGSGVGDTELKSLGGFFLKK